MEQELSVQIDCSLNDSHDLLISFLNQTDPEYVVYQKTYISVLLFLAACGIFLNSSMIFSLVRGSIHRKRAMGSLVRNPDGKRQNLLNFAECRRT